MIDLTMGIYLFLVSATDKPDNVFKVDDMTTCQLLAADLFDPLFHRHVYCINADKNRVIKVR